MEQDDPATWFTVANEVYYWTDDASPAAVRATLELGATAWLNSSAEARTHPDVVSSICRGALPSEDVARLIQDVTFVAVEAYDGDGYVFWKGAG